MFSIEGRQFSAGIEGKLGCAEAQAAAFPRTVEGPVTVHIIAKKGMTEGGHVGTDLVGPAGDEMNAETGDFAIFQRFVTGDDLTATLNGMVGDGDLRVFRVLQEEGFADGRRGLHEAFDQADIVLFQRAGTENLPQNIR